MKSSGFFKIGFSAGCIAIAGIAAALVVHSGDVPMSPWKSIGGCGAGGSGGGGGGVPWVGRGVTGGLVDLQLMGSQNIGQNFRDGSMSTRLSFKPRYDLTVGLSIPLVTKLGPLQPNTALAETYHVTGGLGDLAIDVSQSLGMEGEFSLGFSLSLPTGQFDVKRGNNAVSYILPSGRQKGSGLYGAGLSLGYSKDVGKTGMYSASISYSHPMAFSFNGKNQFVDKYYSQFKNSKDNKRFYYTFKPYGENDLGDYTPPSISVSGSWGFKDNLNVMPAVGFSFSKPLGLAWVHEEGYSGSTTPYNPRVDTDNKAWSGALTYSMEFSRKDYPFLIGVAMPIHSKSDITGKNLALDTKDLFQGWAFAVGMKATMF